MIKILVVVGLVLIGVTFQNCSVSDSAGSINSKPTTLPIPIGLPVDRTSIEITHFANIKTTPINRVHVFELGTSLNIQIPEDQLINVPENLDEIVWKFTDVDSGTTDLTAVGRSIDLLRLGMGSDKIFNGRITAHRENKSVIAFFFLTQGDIEGDVPAYVSDLITSFPSESDR